MRLKNYAFVSLAVGVEYRKKVETLIYCVNTFTTGDIIILTDDVKYLEQCVDASAAMLDHNRIQLIDISSVTNQTAFCTPDKVFNYNLKYFPTKFAYDTGRYDLIIHADADAFLLGWDENDFQKFIDGVDVGVIARFRNRPIEEVPILFLIQPKADQLSINLNEISAGLPIEVFMFFNPNDPQFNKFMETWGMMVDRCYSRSINPFMEALEISYAISSSKVSCKPILDYLNSYSSLHTFRYLHQNQILRIL